MAPMPCPLCDPSDEVAERLATAELARRMKEQAQRDEAHREWIEEHTEDGTLAEIQDVLSP